MPPKGSLPGGWCQMDQLQCLAATGQILPGWPDHPRLIYSLNARLMALTKASRPAVVMLRWMPTPQNSCLRLEPLMGRVMRTKAAARASAPDPIAASWKSSTSKPVYPAPAMPLASASRGPEPVLVMRSLADLISSSASIVVSLLVSS